MPKKKKVKRPEYELAVGPPMVEKAVPKKKRHVARPTIVAVGFDISTNAIAAAAKMYDGVLNKQRGPVWLEHRWPAGTHYYHRMRDCAKAHEIITDLLGQMKGVVFDSDSLHIGVEEPWPFGLVKKAQSGYLKQQAQIQGAFIASLLRWGYDNIYEVNVKSWRGAVADDMEMKQNADFDKWTVKEWAQEVYDDIPDWPDLIKGKGGGLVPKPEDSVAKPVQPDDRYDATGIMDWTWDEAHKIVKIQQEQKAQRKIEMRVKEAQ